MSAHNREIKADRFAPYRLRLLWKDVDLTAAVFRMSVRGRADAPGSAIHDLIGVGSETVTGITAKLITEGSRTHTAVDFLITLNDMKNKTPAAPLPGRDVELFYDIHIQPPAAPQIDQVIFRGPFIVQPGAVQP